MSLKTRIAVAVSALFVIAAGAIAFWTLALLEAEKTASLATEALDVAAAMADNVDTKLRMVHGTLIAVAATVPQRALEDFQFSETFLGRQVALHALFDNGLFLVAVDGRLIGENPPRPARRGSDVSAREYFHRTIDTGKPCISKPYRSTHNPGEPALIMTAPIFNPDGKMIGLLYGSMDLLGSNLLSDLALVRLGRTGYLFLSDGRDTMISHPDKGRIMQPLPSPGENVLFDKAVDGYEGSGQTISSTGVALFQTFRRVKSTGWILGVNLPLEEFYAPIRQARRYFLASTAIGTLVFLVLVWLLTHRLISPLLTMTRQITAMVGAPSAQTRLAVGSRDEIGILATAFNAMLERLSRLNAELEQRISDRTTQLQQTNRELTQSLDDLRQAQTHLVKSEKMAALGALVAGLAHEINTPVGTSVTATSHLQMKVRNLTQDYQSGTLSREQMARFLAIAAESAAIVLANLKRAADLVRSFKAIAIDQASGERRTFRLKPYLDDILVSLSPQLRRNAHQVNVDCPRDLELDSYPGAISQIVTNLVMNSVIHGFEDRMRGRIDIAVDTGEGCLRLTYRDDGKGIAPEYLEKVFDPFFTTRRGAGGSGLGMHIVYNLVSRTLGGMIACTSIQGQGVCFEIRVPVQSPFAVIPAQD